MTDEELLLLLRGGWALEKEIPQAEEGWSRVQAAAEVAKQRSLGLQELELQELEEYQMERARQEAANLAEFELTRPADEVSAALEEEEQMSLGLHDLEPEEREAYYRERAERESRELEFEEACKLASRAKRQMMLS